jgi:amino acid adenylation domain-containing protein
VQLELTRGDSPNMGNTVQVKEPAAAAIAKLAVSNAITPRTQGDTAPLSFAQQQIWLHTQMVPGIPVYNEPVTIHRQGTLDVRALELALTEIVRRHQAWRTTISLAEGEPIQVIGPPAPVTVPFVDLSQLPVAQRESEAHRLAVQDAMRPFDLSRWPLFRVLLVRFSDVEHRLFFTLHHIIFDGYSIYRVLLPELAGLYTAFSRREASPLSDLPIQYSDFAIWERDWLPRGGRLSSQLAYWRERLSGNPPALQLPYDHLRPAIQSFRGAIHPVSLSKNLADALKALSRQEGATLFMTLLTGFAALLHRYSGRADVAIGTVSSGRKRSELEGLLGYFMNPLVLQNDLAGDPTFRELLRRTRNVTLDALSNDDAPFTQVVNEVRPNRSLSFNPLFQVLLTLEPPLPQAQDGWSVALTQSEVDTEISKFDLCLELDDRPSGIVGRFKYSTDLFEPETVARMANHITMLMESACANPDQRISALPILSAQERQQLCVEWNSTSAAFPAHLRLHDLFADQVKQAPDADAVVDGVGQLTYADLDRKSNQLAAYLQQHGVGPEMPVGLFVEPSSEMIIGILGVLKAGGACVPLDPTYPAERLQHVFADSQLRVLLTQQHLKAGLPAADDVEVLCLDSDWALLEQQSSAPVSSQAGPDNLAYVIYTSGSTGKPKGVQVTHRNLVHSTYARSIYYGPDAGRFLLLSSFAFDSSLVGIFGTLSRGGTLVLTPGPLQGSLTRLAPLIAQHRISHLLCVPSLYSLLLDQAKPEELASLRAAIVAGESCPAELVARHYRLLPGATLYNEYGPTEASVWSTVHKCQANEPSRLVPIGRPIPNAQVHVLDTHLNLLPVGVPGELHVGGPGVARGYLNRPAETAERFIRDPFQHAPDARLYKTGDLVRWRTDGNLELLGRLDQQVKIRGFRVELEEIEAVISEYPGVRQAAVGLREAGLREKKKGEPSLVAYVVPLDAAQFDAEKLRSFLSKRLPEAMVPSAFISLENLPLMPNGKLNRQALAMEQTVSVTAFVPPENALQSELVEVWKAVLGKQEIGITDNFFDLGGNSLLVAKLLLRIEQRLGKALTLANIFQAPTIRQLAALVGGQDAPVHHPAIVPIQPEGSKPPLFWVRGGPLFLPLAHRLGTDRPLLGLHLPADEAARLQVPYKLEDIAGALLRCLRQVQPNGPYFIAGLCVNGVIAYEISRQLVEQGEEIALLVVFDAQNPAYYEDFSQESRSELLRRRVGFQFSNLRRSGLPGLADFLNDRVVGVRRRLSVRYWRACHAFHRRVSIERLEDLEHIVHPASFVYRPKPYPGRVVFFQSTDWPKGRYWDFHASWNGLIGGDLELHKIRGGHESMFHEENVDLLADKLRVCLKDTEGDKDLSWAAAKKTTKSAAPRLREATFEDHPQIAALESRYGLQPKKYEEWIDLWNGNPAYQQASRWPIGWVCENADHEIVGSIANIPLIYEFDDEPLRVATSRSLVVDSRYRPYSFALLSEFFNQPNVDLFLNTTVNAKASKLQEMFQCLRVPAGDWDRSSFWITNYRAFTMSFLNKRELRGAPGLSYPLSAGLFLRDALTGRALHSRRNGVEVRFSTHFDESFDQFWSRFRKSSPGCLRACRSREVLQWHFGNALKKKSAWVLSVNNGDDLVAYAIVCRQDNPGLELKRMRLIDLQAQPGHAELLKPILYRALQRCHDEGIYILEAVGFSGEKQRIIESTNPHHRELASWRYFYRANNERLAARLKNPAPWDPSCFDGDSSL